jgi:hypothetical protein
VDDGRLRGTGEAAGIVNGHDAYVRARTGPDGRGLLGISDFGFGPGIPGGETPWFPRGRAGAKRDGL